MRSVWRTVRFVLCVLAVPTVGLDAAMIEIKPGESVQGALDALPPEGGVCRLLKGTHVIRESIALHSNVTLEGEGAESILKLAPDANAPLLVNAAEDVHDITIRNLVIDGGLQPDEQRFGREHHTQRDQYRDVGRKQAFGILFAAFREGPMRHIRLEHLTITGCAMGCHIKGAENVTIAHCLFVHNGAVEAFFHNLYLRRDRAVRVNRCVFRDSPTGNGFNGSYMEDVEMADCLAIGNHFRGIRFAETQGIVIRNCIARSNGNVGLIINSEKNGCRRFTLENNVSGENGVNGIEVRSSGDGELLANLSRGNKVQDYFFKNAFDLNIRNNSGQRVEIDGCRDLQRQGNEFDAGTAGQQEAVPLTSETDRSNGLVERLLKEAGARK